MWQVIELILKKKKIPPRLCVLPSINDDWTETEVETWMLPNFPFPSSLAISKERRREWARGLEEAGRGGCLSSCVSGETWAPKIVVCLPSTHSWWLRNTWLNYTSQNSLFCAFLGRVGHKRHFGARFGEQKWRGSHIGSCASKVGACSCVSFCLPTHLLVGQQPALQLSPGPLGPASAFLLLG